jgi:hypothetical protein
LFSVLEMDSSSEDDMIWIFSSPSSFSSTERNLRGIVPVVAGDAEEWLLDVEVGEWLPDDGD